MEILEEGIRARNRGALVRLEMGVDSDEDLIELLTTYLKLDPHDIYEYSIPLNLGRLWDIVHPRVSSPFNSSNIYSKDPSTIR